MSIALRESAELLNKIYGTEQVENITVDECGELVQAIMKLQRKESGDLTLNLGSNKIWMSVDEEIADVLINIARLQDKLNNYDRVNFYMNQKIDKMLGQVRRIVHEEEKLLLSQDKLVERGKVNVGTDKSE